MFACSADFLPTFVKRLNSAVEKRLSRALLFIDDYPLGDTFHNLMDCNFCVIVANSSGWKSVPYDAPTSRCVTDVSPTGAIPRSIF